MTNRSRLQPSALLCMAILYPWPATARADVLILVGGDRRAGLVNELDGEPDFVELIDSGGTIRVPRSRILNIVKEPRAVGLLAIGDQFFQKELYQESLQYYRQAQGADPDLKTLKERIEQVEAKLDRVALQQRKEGIQQIHELLRQARDAMEEGDFDSAQLRVAEAETLKPEAAEAEEMRDIRINLFMAWGLERLDKLDNTGAAEKFQAVLHLAPRHRDASSELIDIWENDRSKTEELRAMLEARYAENENDQTAIKMLADIAFREREYEKALPYYGKLFEDANFRGTDVETRLQTILETLRTEAAGEGRIQDAISFHVTLMELFPDTDDALLSRYNYLLRKSQLDPTDEQQWLDLAEWAAEQDIGDNEVLELYRRVLTINRDNPKALRAMEIVATQRLMEAKKVFTRQEYELARSLFEAIGRDFPRATDVRADALEWADMALIEITKKKEDDLIKAERLIASGNNYMAQAQAEQNRYTRTSQYERESPQIVNPRRKAITYYQYAINSYVAAQKLSPSLPAIQTGELRINLKEARQMMARLQNPIDYGLPPVNINTRRRSNR